MFVVTGRFRPNIRLFYLRVSSTGRSSFSFSQRTLGGEFSDGPKQKKKVSKHDAEEEESGEPVIFSDEWHQPAARTRKEQQPHPGRSPGDEPVFFSDELTTSLRTKTTRRRTSFVGLDASTPLSIIEANQPNKRNVRVRTSNQQLPNILEAGPSKNEEAKSRAERKTSRSYPSEAQLGALTQELTKLKESVFRLNGPFRELQLEAILSASVGRNVMCVVPTGSGKSLIYQLPALVEPTWMHHSKRGVTVVVSPLKALMNDQAKYLQDTLGPEEIGVLHGDLSREIQCETLAKIRSLRYLFVTPETLLNARVIRALVSHFPQRFVFDEAHCIVEWGRSFRPKYRDVCKVVRETFKGVPWMFLTATAPPDVRACLLDTFGINARDIDIFVSENADRNNLEYRIVRKPSTRKRTLELIHSLLPGSGNTIIYCLTKDECDHVAADLEELMGMDVPVYHAGLSSTARNAVLVKWQLGLTPVIVATTAFGMGMHNASVRLVLHHSMPMSIFNYIQQCGRAGRDGKPARCVLLYDEKAAKMAYQLADDNSSKNEVDEMVSFCKSSTCVRQIIHAKLSGIPAASLGKCRSECQCRDRC